ncbi:hypothetical protein P3342_011015 [Pyrenophora teres f. teres]|uniref:CypX n=1 Tax=Pyrenophora teres f. teres TaxID=97479 RepID=A0A6S6WGM7_9PLEO|nr:hypothetical protein HRS9139_10537 [Pyrenophora teres f. teres]KAE8829285.1 hypothetical protein PTNB85_08473 [Pyrenophora teres f. teres]KAE8830448.1 hypothetical protein HRS9139_07072 [Pyrenophora teres f. teres]KAE8841217.1 hypothetical protein HRS9122_05343 [Pyrenophora teres f. teres]KAE8859318.1 hypothetical protein PTNB29_06549 [Pyrenophora teres f. teres]
MNDSEAVDKVFGREDLDTSPTSIRALRVGGHDWTFTYPQHPIVPQRCHPVMIATRTRNLGYRHDIFVTNTEAMSWTKPELGAEMASQALAVTETISSALVFIYYELAKSQETQREVYKEVLAHDGYEELDSLKLLEACIEKGLKFRPLVTLTGSRMVPAGGMDVFGYYLAEGTVITTQSLSMSRQRPDPFPDFDNSTYYADLMKRTALRNGVILSHPVSTLIAAQEKTW